MNRFESVAYARHSTAILEEAAGDGVPSDLAARVTQRLATTRVRPARRRLLLAAVMMAGAAVVFAVATQPRGVRDPDGIRPAIGGGEPPAAAPQDPVASAPVIVLTLRRVLVAEPREGESRQRVVWRVGDKELQTLATLREELRRLANDPSLRHPAAADATHSEPPRLLIQAAVGTQWSDLVAAVDAAIAAPFTDIRFAGVDTSWLVPKAVAPAEDGLRVPEAEFSEPDEAPDDTRPAICLFQDGRITFRGKTWFRPVEGEPDDLADVARRLRELRAELIAKGLVEPQGSDLREGLRVPILIRADRGIEWAKVQRFLALATAKDVGFWKIEMAVSESPTRRK